ncbi:MAG: RNA polymerase sigma factor [Lachnospiraceae bacterium]|nr:RNA polymerase sigma factor [Lachnospiraceae bacterium]MBQ3906648.1 RNA polymerase sigma factor [Lachnospiraceae bacterium]
MQETDEVIYDRFLATRSEEDFRILLERHRESLVLFLYGMIHNMEDAEDLMLDAFAEAAAGARFAGRSSFKTWLFSIGKKMALMHLRKQRRLLRSEESAEDTPVDAPPEMEILRVERNRQLYQGLLKLTEDYRQILILLFYEQMSPEEAGRVMGKNKKQIYNLAERGKKALRSELERMGFDYAQYG